MSALKWLLTALTAIFTLLTVASMFGAIWVVDGELCNRLSATAFASFFISVPTGGLAALLWGEGK